MKFKYREAFIKAFDKLIRNIESSFIAKFIRKVKTWISKIINNNNNIYALDKFDIGALRVLYENFYKELSKATIDQTRIELKQVFKNKKMKAVSNKSKIDFPALAKKTAIQKVKAFQRLLKSKIEKLAEKTAEAVTSAIKSVFGIFKARHIETATETESINIVNTERFNIFNKQPDIIAVQFIAVIDDRTTKYCRPRDQFIISLEDPMIEDFTPPLHFYCRSHISPINKKENIIYTSQIDLKSVPKPLFNKEQKDKYLYGGLQL